IFFFLIVTILIGVFTYFSGVEISSPGIMILVIWFIVLVASIGGFLTFDSGSSNVNTVMEQFGFLFIYTLLVVSFFIHTIRRANE
ncbi:unnamed protein product, partial [marine sediment metagenome]